MKPDDIAQGVDYGYLDAPQPRETLGATLEAIASAKRILRKAEKRRLQGVFIPTKRGPNRKQRRAMRASKLL